MPGDCKQGWPYSNSLEMGLLCAAVGGVVGVWLALTAGGAGYFAFVTAAPVATLLSGTFWWWLLIVRTDCQHRFPAVMAGMLAAVSGHILCWYFLMLGTFIWSAAGKLTTFGPVMNPLQALPATVLYGALSLYFFGWITIPTGALLGGLLATVQARRRRTPASTGS